MNEAVIKSLHGRITNFIGASELIPLTFLQYFDFFILKDFMFFRFDHFVRFLMILRPILLMIHIFWWTLHLTKFYMLKTTSKMDLNFYFPIKINFHPNSLLSFSQSIIFNIKVNDVKKVTSRTPPTTTESQFIQ